MSKRLNWERDKAIRLGQGPSTLADPDMLDEPDYREWWAAKSHKEKTDAREALDKVMSEAFSKGRPVSPERLKEKVDALISPAVTALLREAASRQKRREAKIQRIEAGAKRKRKPAKRQAPKGQLDPA